MHFFWILFESGSRMADPATDYYFLPALALLNAVCCIMKHIGYLSAEGH